MPESYDVVVIGAGIGGLSAARLLRRAGMSVLVLEAKERVGGRMLSLPIAGRLVEIGGRWTGPNQDRIRALAAELGISTCPSSEQSGRFEVAFNGGFGASGFAV